MKRWILAASVLGICTVLNSFPLSAADKGSNIVLKTDGTDSRYAVKWNGEHNRLLVSSDFVEKSFGAQIEVNGNSVEISKNGHMLCIEKDNEFYLMDGLGGRKMDCLAEFENGRVYLPLRYMCEAFGASVKYDISAQNVSIRTDAIVMEEDIKPYFENVQVFDQSTVRITGEKTIYVDPRRVLGEPHDADIIFITHTHNDHYEIDTIRRVMKPSTVIYITEDGVEQAKADGLTNVIGVVPGKDYDGEGISFSTVAAYNTAADRQNHRQEFNWVGYVININGFTYYSAGDSDFIEEMKNITVPIDVAFLPIDGKYNMDAGEAAAAANAIKPKVAVPYHYNNFVAEDKAEEFVSLLNDNIRGAIVTFKMQ